jgi:hypothetical protein
MPLFAEKRLASTLAWGREDSNLRFREVVFPCGLERNLASRTVRVPSTGGATTPPPGSPLPPGGSYPVRLSHRRGGCRAHLSAASSSGRPLAHIARGAAFPLPSPLASRLRRLVHSSARGRRLARATQSELARRPADCVVDVRVGRWSRRPGGLVGAGAGVSRLPDLEAGWRVVAGVDDCRVLPSEVTL